VVSRTPFIKKYIKQPRYTDDPTWVERELEQIEKVLASLWEPVWRDQIGDIRLRGTGANDPTFSNYRGNLYQFQCRNNGTVTNFYNEFHIQHDYLPGSDIYIHIHWSQIVVDSGGTAGAPGTAEWFFEVSYAKGHQQAAFIAPITTSVTQAASGTQYMHNIAEVQLSAASPSAAQLDSDDIEVDGLVLVRTYRNGGTGNDTLNQNPFVHYVDLHYQASLQHFGTKNKAPDFYE